MEIWNLDKSNIKTPAVLCLYTLYREDKHKDPKIELGNCWKLFLACVPLMHMHHWCSLKNKNCINIQTRCLTEIEFLSESEVNSSARCLISANISWCTHTLHVIMVVVHMCFPLALYAYCGFSVFVEFYEDTRVQYAWLWISVCAHSAVHPFFDIFSLNNIRNPGEYMADCALLCVYIFVGSSLDCSFPHRVI